MVLNIPAAAIRPGQPGCEAPFTDAYNAAGGNSRLGPAIGEVYETGKGWVQHFAGTPSGEPTVICALYGRSAVSVAGSVWDEICAIGGGHPGGGTEGAGSRSARSRQLPSSVRPARKLNWPEGSGARAAWSATTQAGRPGSPISHSMT